MREGHFFRQTSPASVDGCRVTTDEAENVTEDLYEIILINGK